MWLDRAFLRKSNRGSHYYRAAVMCVAALSLLLARSAPPSLPHTFADSAVISGADDTHRFLFDQENFQWGTFASFAQSTPPPVAAPHRVMSAEPSLEVSTKGWHYNRPPPIR